MNIPIFLMSLSENEKRELEQYFLQGYYHKLFPLQKVKKFISNKNLSKYSKKILHQGVEIVDKIDNPVLQIIFSAIHREFHFSKENLKYGRDRKRTLLNRNNALHVCALLLYEYGGYRPIDIATILNKDKSDICRYFQRLHRIQKAKLKNKELIFKIKSAKKYVECALRKVKSIK